MNRFGIREIMMVRACILKIVTLAALFCGGATWAQNAPADDTKAISIEAVREAVRSLPADERPPARYALVIGAGSFTDRRIPALPACHNDAEALAAVLKDPGVGMFPAEQVSVLTGPQVTKRAILVALDELGRRAGPDDLVLVFFSGHGATDERGRSYWVMHDTSIDSLRATALPENEITDLLGDIRTTRLVTLIDACFSAATANIGQSKALINLDEIYPRFNGEGRVAITASSGEQLSVVIQKGDEGRGYSAFAWHVINGLKGAADGSNGNADGVVTVDELWSYVKDRTEQTARREGGDQQPQLKGQMGSRFMLTVDRERLVRNTTEHRARTTRLRELFLEGVLDPEQYREAETLLTAAPGTLDAMKTGRRKAYEDLADGVLEPRWLNAALSQFPLETAAERSARLERERIARELAAREARIASLLDTARANDNKANGRRALEALDELLRLDPENRMAQELRRKIAGYYVKHLDRKTVELAPGVMAEFVYIDAPAVAPDGFMMGSPASEEARYDDEAQFRAVLTRGYWMQTTEVTQGQWQAVMGSNPSHFKNGASYPVEQVSWDDSQLFIGRLRQRGIAARLPTEAEWEFACRAGSTTPFNTGSTISTSQANFDGNFTYANGRKGEYRRRTMPVGSFAANAWGLHDMHGNVWEWCQDWYGAYPSGRVVNPSGTQTGSGRVLRGGSWGNVPWSLRSAFRLRNSPSIRGFNYGFRLTLDSE